MLPFAISAGYTHPFTADSQLLLLLPSSKKRKENPRSISYAARVQLKTKDARAANATLNEHRTLYPHGVLAEEAAALRIEVLAELGDERNARASAAAFLKAYPESPYAERVRTVVSRLSAIRAE